MKFSDIDSHLQSDIMRNQVAKYVLVEELELCNRLWGFDHVPGELGTQGSPCCAWFPRNTVFVVRERTA